jgi:hypothetical protein
VRSSTRIFRVLAVCGRKRQAQAFFLSIAALCAAASANAAPATVGTKQAQAEQVLAQIQKIDDSLGAAVESYNLANVQLKKIESDQRENRLQLKLTRANLKVAQDSLAARLVTAYTSTQDNTTLSVLLGATSLDDLLNRIEAVDSTSQQDASIVQQVTSFKASIQRHRVALRTAHSPDALLGRIGSTARTISLGLQPIGLLVGGALVDLTSGSTTIALMGLSVAILSLAFAPVDALRRAAIVPR